MWAPVARGRRRRFTVPRRAQLLYRTAADSLSLGAPSQTVLGQAAAASVRLKSAKCLAKLHKYNEAIQEVPDAARLLGVPLLTNSVDAAPHHQPARALARRVGAAH